MIGHAIELTRHGADLECPGDDGAAASIAGSQAGGGGPQLTQGAHRQELAQPEGQRKGRQQANSNRQHHQLGAIRGGLQTIDALGRSLRNLGRECQRFARDFRQLIQIVIGRQALELFVDRGQGRGRVGGTNRRSLVHQVEFSLCECE